MRNTTLFDLIAKNMLDDLERLLSSNAISSDDDKADALIMAAQLLLGLSILVGVHEAGHMLAAKYFGMRVEKFSIGFPPKIWGFKKGETEYSIGAIPLGGFVKISGMVDDAISVSQLETPARLRKAASPLELIQP